MEAHFLCVGLKDKKLVEKVAIETNHSREITPSIGSLKLPTHNEADSYEVDSVFNIKVSLAYYDFVN